MEVAFTAELWEYEGKAAWHFITIPRDFAHDIREIADGAQRGFGSVKVRAQIGGSQWETSIFPDGASGSYFLPIKKVIRQAESIKAGDSIAVRLVISTV